MSEISRISDDVRSLLENPIKFSDIERDKYFSLTDSQKDIFDNLDSDINKVGFLIQLGYFKLNHSFYGVNKFSDQDIQYINNQFDLKVDLKSYYADRSRNRHKKVILNILGIKPFKESEELFDQELYKLTNKTIDLETIIKELKLLAKAHKFELPTSYLFAKKINQSILERETYFISSFNKQFDNIDDKTISKQFCTFLEPIIKNDGTESNRPKLTTYKKISQSYRPRKLSQAVKDFLLFKRVFKVIDPIIKSLNITDEVIQHFAIWIVKAKTFQIKQRSQDKIKFYLACFTYHYYYLRQDALILSMIKGVKEQLNKIDKEMEVITSRTTQIYGQLTETLHTSRSNFKRCVSMVEKEAYSKLSIEEKLENIKSIIGELRELEKNISEQDIDSLFDQANEIKASIDEYTLLEKYSVRIQNRASKIILHLEFSNITSNPQLLAAIEHYKDKEGNINHLSPTDFLSKKDIDNLYDHTNKFRTSLYKSLLITKITEAIRSGVINLKYSYKYLTLQEYLISKEDWSENKKQFLKDSDLETFTDIRKLLLSLRKKVTKQFSVTNANINDGTNNYVSLQKDGKLNVRTVGVVKANTDKVSDLFKDAKYTSALEILNQVNQLINYTDPLKHHSISAPKVKPSYETFYAALIGIGCNLGIHKLAGTAKGVTLNKIENVTNWYLSKQNLYKANNKVIQEIDKLDLPKLLLNNNIKHGASDGMQTNIQTESLNSNQSYKYSGLSKGVSVYSFVDNRGVLFYSTVISPEEREAAYVIDGLFDNNEVKVDIHSTDTHGYSEIIHAITFLLKIAFAPRIKQVKKEILYSFDSPSYYIKQGYKLTPKKIIKQALIEDQWDDILRLVASIRLRYATASQIFKRLSSYSLENPLYKALKQFGRIIKTIFILIYYDDLQIRQLIQKQLNLVELSNKFSKAVFFDKQSEFVYQDTKEEQEVAVLCKQLIQNIIIYWNYCYLTQKLIDSSDDDVADLILTISNGTVMNWGHINMYGEYDFSNIEQYAISLDLEKILNYTIETE